MCYLSPLSYIHLFVNVPHINRNFKIWEEHKYPILFITGLAGSGKTFLAQQLAFQYGAVLVSLDSLKYYKDSSEENKKIVDEFFSIHPEISSCIYEKTTNKSQADKLYSEHSKMFTDFVIQKAFADHKRYIIEGIHLFMRLPSEITNKKPLIILGTSYTHSIFQKFRREYLSGINEYRKHKLYDIFDDLFIYEFKQLNMLNVYISCLPKTCV